MKGQEEAFGVNNILIILIMVMVLQVYTHVKIHHIL